MAEGLKGRAVQLDAVARGQQVHAQFMHAV